MSDPIDRAQALEQMQREIALANFNNQQKKQAYSAYYCAECDEPIPEKRRQAVKGCVLCVDCQEELEHAKARKLA